MKIHIGLILEDLVVPAWARAMLEKIKALDCADLVVLVISGEKVAGSSPFPASLRRRPLLRSLVWFDRLLFSPRPDAFRESGIEDLVGGVPILQVKSETIAGETQFSEADVESIRAFRPDVLVSIDPLKLRGSILSSAPGGVWETFVGEPGRGCNDVPGFFEVTERHGVTVSGARVREGNGYRILYQSSATTDPWSVRRNNNSVLWKSSSFIPRLLRQFADTGSLPQGDAAKPERPAPGDLKAALAGMSLYLRYVWYRLRLLFVREEWRVLIRKEDTLSRSWKGFRPLAAPKGLFWTDPFLFSSGKRKYLIMEEYASLDRPAHVSLAALDEDGAVGAPVRVLERSHHVSYPFVFEWEGCLYMIPESGARRTIELYTSAPDVIEWRFVMNLMENVEAYDTTLYFDGQRWWLMSCMAENPGSGHYDELFLFSASDFRTNQWKAHPRNPVVSDVTHARPAGALLRMNGKLCRPAQDSAKMYGRNLMLCEIQKLSEEEYVEVAEPFFEDPRPPGVIAVHTLNHSSGFTVIDAMKTEWRFA